MVEGYDCAQPLDTMKSPTAFVAVRRFSFLRRVLNLRCCRRKIEVFLSSFRLHGVFTYVEFTTRSRSARCLAPHFHAQNHHEGKGRKQDCSRADFVRTLSWQNLEMRILLRYRSRVKVRMRFFVRLTKLRSSLEHSQCEPSQSSKVQLEVELNTYV